MVWKVAFKIRDNLIQVSSSYAGTSVVKRSAVHQIQPLLQQAASGYPISQQTHPQQPGKTRIYPSMLTNRQVPVLYLTETNITSHADLQDAFQSLCVCTHGGKESTEDQSTE